MRLAGTARQYSKKAMPQLTGMTSHSDALGNLSCPYQAKVMNTFEKHSRIIGATSDQVMRVPREGRGLYGHCRRIGRAARYGAVRCLGSEEGGASMPGWLTVTSRSRTRPLASE